MKALTVKNLKKVYPSFTLGELSFSVEEGRVVGFIGANGAGKSTTIKSILGLISSQGKIEFAGDGKQDVGYVGGGFRYYPMKTLGAIINSVKPFYSNWDDRECESYLNKFALEKSKKVKELSEGMKVKFAITLALSHKARLLILDEPTSGLDPLSRDEICSLLYELSENGVTVFFSTHVTEDLEKIADDVIFISHGKIIADEPLKTLKDKYVSAVWQDESERSDAIGVRREKHGYTGLLKKGAPADGAEISEATLDEIMICLERETR